MRISKLITTAAMATVLSAGVASASTFGTISTSGGNSALQPLGFGTSLDGWFGSKLWASGAGTLTATLMGVEAGYTNTFKFGDDPLNALNSLTDTGKHFDASGALGQISTVVTSAGLLDFSFLTSGADGVVDCLAGECVKNADNPNNGVNSGINFFTSFANPQASSGVVAWLFFDDGGVGADDNHDDLVIKLAFESGGGGGITNVPVPAAGFLLFGALGGLAALRRRKKKTA